MSHQQTYLKLGDYWQQLFSCLLVISTFVLLLVVVARGQEKPASSAAAVSPSPVAQSSPAATPTPAPSPVPLAEVVTQAETVQAGLRDIEAELSSDQITATVDGELPIITRELDARLEENARILNSRPSLETLRNLEADWTKLGEKLPAWRRDLTTRATELDRELARLAALGETWQQTLDLARGASPITAEPVAPENGGATTPTATPSPVAVADAVATVAAPPEILQRIEATIAAIRQTRAQVETRRAQVLSLQSRVAEQNARVAAALGNVKQVRDETVSQLFVKDSPPLWSAEVRARASRNLMTDSQNSFSTQVVALGAYARRQWPQFVLHAFILLMLVAALYWARRRVQPWVVEEPSLEGVAQIFNLPVATALILSILLSGWIYPQAPRLLSAILGAAALVPTVIILRQLVERHLYPILNALVIFYFVDQLRAVASALALMSRLLFLAEMLGGIIFLVWLIKSARLSEVAKEDRGGLWTGIKFGGRVALAVFAAAFIANALGYVSLGSLIGNAALGSAYLAIILYAAIRIADGLIMFASRVRPLALLGIVNRHRPLLRRRIHRVLRWVATLLWALFTLELLSLRVPLIERVKEVLAAQLTVGAFSLSLGDVLAFVLTVWAAFLISRFLRFVLEEDIYPRTHLARGIPYAVSTMLHYAVLLVGFFIAVAAMGIDMTKFTILAGAFGVGLGFGMQNIVNNFVSGLILLFERPVRVNDVIQLDGAGGVVERIGIRASVVRTWDSSEIIVPNSKLISDRVTNWTFSNRTRGFEIEVGVEYGTNPQQVVALLHEVAAANPLVAETPAPQPLFVGFGADSLDFKLRVWTEHSESWVQLRSDLAVAINTVFERDNILIPNTQRDIHVRSIDPEAARAFRRSNPDGASQSDEHNASAE